MAVWVYKDGKGELVQPRSLHNMLNAGWSLTKDESDAEAEKEESTNDAETETSESELEVLRAKAKSQKVKGWQRMSVETLREKVDG